MIQFHDTTVSAQFDSGSYMGTFVINHESLNWIAPNHPIFLQLEAIIALEVDKLITEPKDN